MPPVRIVIDPARSNRSNRHTRRRGYASVAAIVAMTVVLAGAAHTSRILNRGRTAARDASLEMQIDQIVHAARERFGDGSGESGEVWKIPAEVLGWKGPPILVRREGSDGDIRVRWRHPSRPIDRIFYSP